MAASTAKLGQVAKSSAAARQAPVRVPNAVSRVCTRSSSSAMTGRDSLVFNPCMASGFQQSR